MNPGLVTKDLLNVVVALGRKLSEQKPPIIYGTGVLVNFKGLAILVTAKHVIHNLSKFEDSCVFSNSKDGKIVVKTFHFIKDTINQDWILHPEKNIDLAITFFPFNPEIELIKIVPENLFAQPKDIEIGSDAFVYGYPFGISSRNSVIPIVRRALIAGKSIEGHYFLDAPIFRGNDGGPIFLRPSIQRPDGNIVIGGTTRLPKLVGFVKSFLQSKEGYPLHLSEIVSIEKLREFFYSDSFNQIYIRVKENSGII